MIPSDQVLGRCRKHLILLSKDSLTCSKVSVILNVVSYQRLACDVQISHPWVMSTVSGINSRSFVLYVLGVSLVGFRRILKACECHCSTLRCSLVLREQLLGIF